MFTKGGKLQTRVFSMQKHALEVGRNFMGKLNHAYHTGKSTAHTIDQGYKVLKHIHGRIQPALADQAPGLAKAAKQIMGSYEATKSAVQGIDSIGQTFAGNIRQL